LFQVLIEFKTDFIVPIISGLRTEYIYVNDAACNASTLHWTRERIKMGEFQLLHACKYNAIIMHEWTKIQGTCQFSLDIRNRHNRFKNGQFFSREYLCILLRWAYLFAYTHLGQTWTGLNLFSLIHHFHLYSTQDCMSLRQMHISTHFLFLSLSDDKLRLKHAKKHSRAWKNFRRFIISRKRCQ